MKQQPCHGDANFDAIPSFVSPAVSPGSAVVSSASRLSSFVAPFGALVHTGAAGTDSQCEDADLVFA